MVSHTPHEDPRLGAATWVDGDHHWALRPSLPTGSEFTATITPMDSDLPLSDRAMKPSLDCIAWVADNEPSARKFVADKMYDLMLDWYDEDDEPPSRAQFFDSLALDAVLVLEDHEASVLYKDGGFFGGHAIVFSVAPNGKFTDDPHLWG